MAERWTPERRRNRTRTALMDAAAEVFAANGYHAAALDDIAEAAGFTRGAIYSQFAGKEGLFLATVSRHAERRLAAFDAVLHAGTQNEPPSSAAFADLWHQLVVEDRMSVCLMLEFRLLAMRNPAVAQQLADFERHLEAMITRVIDQRQADGTIALAGPTGEVAVLLYVASQGLQEHQIVCTNPHTGLFARLLEMALGLERPVGVGPRQS